jgi:hypothetical protein
MRDTIGVGRANAAVPAAVRAVTVRLSPRPSGIAAETPGEMPGTVANKRRGLAGGGHSVINPSAR